MFQLRYWPPVVLQRCHKVRKNNFPGGPRPHRTPGRIASSPCPILDSHNPPTATEGLRPHYTCVCLLSHLLVCSLSPLKKSPAVFTNLETIKSIDLSCECPVNLTLLRNHPSKEHFIDPNESPVGGMCEEGHLALWQSLARMQP